MASLIESVRKLHGPSLVAHESGYDVDVICEECTRLRLEALDQAAGEGVDLSYSAESVRSPYPCSTRVVAGTTAAEGKDEATRMRLEHLVVQREEIEEQIERLDAVIGLIRRDLDEDAPEPDGDCEPDDGGQDRGNEDAEPEDSPGPDEKPAPTKRATKAKGAKTSAAQGGKATGKPADPGDEFDF